MALALQFFGGHVALADKTAFRAYLGRLRRSKWVVYAKEPFAGPGGNRTQLFWQA
jgi:hypothetical protein